MLDGPDECKRRVPRGVAVPFGRGSDHSDLHRLGLYRDDAIVRAEYKGYTRNALVQLRP